MAPAVPFALLGVVQLVAVAAWLGLAGAALFPRLRRRVTPAFVAGALALALADALTATSFGTESSDSLAWLRCAGLALLAIGTLGGSPQTLVLPLPGGATVAGVVVPLGARPTPTIAAGAAGALAGGATWWRSLRPGADRLLGALLAGGFLLAALAAALGGPARSSMSAALALLAARAAATALIIGALVLLASTLLLGKVVGAIVAGVVVMAAGAVGVVGTGVAAEVQHEQSQRLLQVANSQANALQSLATRTELYAQVVAQCPQKLRYCEQFLQLFSDHHYFAVLVFPGSGARLISADVPVDNAALLQLAGSQTVREQLATGAPIGGGTGAQLLQETPPLLAMVAAVPVRANNSSDVRVRPSYVAVYGVALVDPYMRSLAHEIGYDVSLVANGQVIATSLGPAARARLLTEARQARVESADPDTSSVVPAGGSAPTAAFVAVTPAASNDVRIATLAISQPANEALRAQRSVLQRLFVTTLVALVVVALLAIALARRIAEPVRRLTVAAGRVRRGDLEATTPVRSRDEVGSLSRAFDAMTDSLRRLTADLRATAAQESALRVRLETVVESMSDGLVVTDEHSVVTGANPTALRLLGRPVEDVVGRRLPEVVVVEGADGPERLDTVTDRGVGDAELVRASGERMPVRFGVAPLGGGQGRVVVLADRSREYEVERMKTEFLANVSHELRTPLTPIRGYAEMLARRPELSRRQVELFLDEILNSTARMSRAVELLVDVAALEGGRIAPQRSQIAVRSLVDDRIAAWRERYPERADDFRRRVAGRLPDVDIDGHWVRRALDELADNAVKYTPAGSPITLVARPADEGRHVQVAVRDSGPGFDPQRTGELVEDFAQADSSETRRVGGLGLGLGFVSRVASRFGLPFEIDTRPGRGSEFALTLPAAATAPPPPRSGGERARRAERPPSARRGR